MKIDQGSLVEAAQKAAKKAYAPYSKFRVGAAILCEDGTVVTGANVENGSFGLTICAERSAVASAVSAGMRRFIAVAIAGLDASYPLPPCGACRQVLNEFFDRDAPVYFCGNDTKTAESTVGALLPFDSLGELKSGTDEPV